MFLPLNFLIFFVKFDFFLAAKGVSAGIPGSDSDNSS